MNRHPTTLRRGFTLVHLLVSAAVVVFSAALLIPAIDRAGDRANLALCQDRLRKIGASLLQYAALSHGELPISPTMENPHVELLQSLSAAGLLNDPAIFYCPGEHRPDFTYNRQNFQSGIIGYYYFCATDPSTNSDLSKFLLDDAEWPRIIDTKNPPNTWLMSDIWVSAIPTSHPGYRKGVNYLTLDGSVAFLGESPRQYFH